jgi:hypothetical protein
MKAQPLRLILAGIALLACGGAGYLWSAPKMDLVRSIIGQFALALGGEATAREAQMYQTVYYGSILLGVVGAILLLGGPMARMQPLRDPR